MNIEDNEKEKFDFLDGFDLSEDGTDVSDNESIIPGELRGLDAEKDLIYVGQEDVDGELESEEEFEDLTGDEDEDEDGYLDEFEETSDVVISEGDITDDGYLTTAELEIVEEHIDGSEVIMDEVIYDSKGTPINSVIEGEMKIRHVALEDIMVPPRGKLFQDDLSELEESIHFWGLVEPIHLVPYKDKFMLLHGYRRLMAYQNMGFDVIPALVNSTRPKEVIRYLEVVSNNVRRYNFIEMMKIGEFIEERQKSFSHDTIENILGLPSGHYLKAKYIEAAKMQFDEIYNKVVKNKMSLEQAFKKIEKELNKEDEELTPLDHLNQFGLDYGEIVEEDHVQQSGERHPLDPALRKYVEGRDFHSCQSCGMGLGEPDLASIFHAHHIIPVKHQGADKKGNLILLCPNCHGYVHAFDEGKFKPSNEMVELYDTIHNTVVLGNIIKRGINEDIDAYDFYMKRAKQSWLDD